MADKDAIQRVITYVAGDSRNLARFQKEPAKVMEMLNIKVNAADLRELVGALNSVKTTLSPVRNGETHEEWYDFSDEPLHIEIPDPDKDSRVLGGKTAYLKNLLTKTKPTIAKTTLRRR